MKFISFRVRNFKGIRDTTIRLNGKRGSIYTLVGLNESGKTTILEAINSFRHDLDGIHAIAQSSISDEPISSLVPKKKKDNFNDEISIEATISIEDQEIFDLSQRLIRDYEFAIDTDSFPRNIKIRRTHYFKNSENTNTKVYWVFSPEIKIKRKKSAKIF